MNSMTSKLLFNIVNNIPIFDDISDIKYAESMLNKMFPYETGLEIGVARSTPEKVLKKITTKAKASFKYQDFSFKGDLTEYEIRPRMKKGKHVITGVRNVLRFINNNNVKCNEPNTSPNMLHVHIDARSVQKLFNKRNLKKNEYVPIFFSHFVMDKSVWYRITGYTPTAEHTEGPYSKREVRFKSSHETFEFRLFYSTLDAGLLLSYIYLCQLFIKETCKMEHFNPATTWSTIVNYRKASDLPPFTTAS